LWFLNKKIKRFSHRKEGEVGQEQEALPPAQVLLEVKIHFLKMELKRSLLLVSIMKALCQKKLLLLTLSNTEKALIRK